jgi:predicted HAD superfamily Cof-like phosphohydrolase
MSNHPSIGVWDADEPKQTMQKNLSLVADFHHAFGHPVKQEIGVPDWRRCELRIALIREELQELEQAFQECDIVKTADALIDLEYVLHGTTLECGLQYKHEALFAEVHRSNMSKLGPDGKPMYFDSGKVKKGPDYQEPDLEKILMRL